MAIVAFLRGINVGGHRSFRPSLVAKDLRAYDVVSVGAAGNFIVWNPRSRANFRAALLRKLPFEAEVALCDGRDLIALQSAQPFGNEPLRSGIVRFVSILTRKGRAPASMPVILPPDGEWYVRVLGSTGPFVFGEYRRQMKTIGYLGQIDKLFGAPAITRGWNTIATIVRLLQER
jgi:uncharacterized protein (DUF1697 family)